VAPADELVPGVSSDRQRMQPPKTAPAADTATIAGLDGQMLLMKASHEGNTDVVEKLIASGADMNARNADGNNAIWLACAGNRLAMIRLLASAGVDVNNQNENGATALIFAASAGKEAAVELLLELGANLALETVDGFSALDLASNLECLALLRRKPRSHDRAVSIAPNTPDA
jgi:ankyrin repeat protein